MRSRAPAGSPTAQRVQAERRAASYARSLRVRPRLRRGAACATPSSRARSAGGEASARSLETVRARSSRSGAAKEWCSTRPIRIGERRVVLREPGRRRGRARARRGARRRARRPSFAAGRAPKVAAAWLIERAGFPKGWRGDASDLAKHALALVNRGGATARELLALAAPSATACGRASASSSSPSPCSWAAHGRTTLCKTRSAAATTIRGGEGARGALRPDRATRKATKPPCRRRTRGPRPPEKPGVRAPDHGGRVRLGTEEELERARDRVRGDGDEEPPGD